MKTRFAITLAAIALCGAAAATAWSGTFSDDFSSGLRPTYWSVTQTTPGLFSVDDTHGGVRLAKVGNNPGGFQNVAINLNMAAVGGSISGDFSMQIDFSNAVIGPNNDQVQLNITLSDNSPFDDVYDISCGNPSVHVWNGGQQGCMAVTGNSGTFKISRTSGTLTGYYNGSQIFSESNSLVVPTITFSLQLQPGSNDNTSVTFDNFSLTAATVPISCTPPPPGMVSWWPGDGNANDIRGGNNGTLENGATFATGLVAQAFSFDGTDQFVQVPDNANIRFGGNMPMSVDMWIYRTSTSQTQHFIGKRQDCNGDANGTYQMGLDFVVSGDCGLFFGQPDVLANTVCSGVDLPLNTWTHLAGTFDGSTIRLYMNGQMIGEQTGASLGPSNTAPLLIGATSLACNPFYPTGGLIDEVEIFNRALSQTEIQAIVDAGSFGKCKGGRPAPTPRPRPTPAPRPGPARS
jgi:hypothetical protein